MIKKERLDPRFKRPISTEDSEGNSFAFPNFPAALEMMAGAMDWHKRAKFIFASKIEMDFEQCFEWIEQGRRFEERGRDPKNYQNPEAAKGHPYGTWLAFQRSLEPFKGDRKAFVEANSNGLSRREIDQKIDQYWKLKDGQT
ncbi:hypothetical protein A2872_01845 [Candidatus Gottesmanbacteria bacterium RIFCSPHIGHO2_01_FULL_42_12]|uniref:Uncharacterized protein n=1 Tax=Candidatus Gottesmanbacteria bacterium RIFCSPHIGHO2_01_FULL_42_12 TaxID=1798377 RepID=A0A1F5Z5L4_9BACT|nr:MAG: hypothetical protein A2872_01845 [Candidatus Gottesmanbacteria bacterium RIFCSPHIGHO2_01_FULL_42_12]